ncbi:hypothetical protein BUALT_Bualt01G0087400 [Buddleja alternifolia]|uniref:Serine protease inhibitor, Kazal-type family protein n=1 Tax=Buddleja alternifolia TaxID=168488 RepID=A0AAV6Y5K8_9LAMI|nr:hypothetical protein BUALT_Bualt01G0087400 [Buddleja alternifolia]
MHLFSSKSSSIFILAVLITTVFPPTVRSNPNLIKQPSDQQQENDICPSNSVPDTCPVKCFRPDPVCGADGVTYWCGCADAHCAGTRVKKFGYCEVGNSGSGPAGEKMEMAVFVSIRLGFGLCCARVRTLG